MSKLEPRQIKAAAETLSDWIIARRREFHQCPELMYQESETSALIRKNLDELGIKWQYPFAETGIVGIIGAGNGPCVAIRADIDALPVNEENDSGFCSKNPGIMHACGHDCHIAMLLGAAKILKEHETELPGSVKLIFQPAEEGGAGADRMCKEGALQNPEVKKIFGMHVWASHQTGKIVGNSGTVLAAVSNFEVTLSGRGGHGASPHNCIDPIVCSAKIITELQSIVARETDPFSPAVVTVGSIHGGEAANVIPETVKFSGTIRSLTLVGLKTLQSRVEEMIKGIAAINRCSTEINYPLPDFPPTVNDPECWALGKSVAEELVGKNNVELIGPAMGGEDFAFYQQLIPGCFAFLGVKDKNAATAYGLHHPRFQPDESALHLGSAWYAAVAVAALQELRQS